MPRYKLRTLLILLAVLPPLLWFGWMKYEAWKAERERQRRAEFIPWMISVYTDLADYSKLPWTVGEWEDMQARGEVESYAGLRGETVERWSAK
jgi:hypothetical protein